MLVRVWFLKVDKVFAGGLQQAVDVKHVAPSLRVSQRHALRNERRTQQVGEANSRRASPKEQVLLVLELRALELGRIDHAGKRDASRALHVIIVHAVLVALALEQMDSVRPRLVLD